MDLVNVEPEDVHVHVRLFASLPVSLPLFLLDEDAPFCLSLSLTSESTI